MNHKTKDNQTHKRLSVSSCWKLTKRNSSAVIIFSGIQCLLPTCATAWHRDGAFPVFSRNSNGVLLWNRHLLYAFFTSLTRVSAGNRITAWHYRVSILGWAAARFGRAWDKGPLNTCNVLRFHICHTMVVRSLHLIESKYSKSVPYTSSVEYLGLVCCLVGNSLPLVVHRHNAVHRFFSRLSCACLSKSSIRSNRVIAIKLQSVTSTWWGQIRPAITFIQATTKANQFTCTRSWFWLFNKPIQYF